MFNKDLKQLFFVHAFDTTEFANASVVPPLPRPVREENAEIATETFMAGNYAKIIARGWGQHQPFVSRRVVYA